MSNPDDNNLPLNVPDLWAALQELEDGSLSVERREALVRQLNRSPAARRAYLEYFHQVAVLRMEASKAEESSQLAVIRPIVSRYARWWTSPRLAAAAAFMLAALIGTLMAWGHYRSKTMRAVAAEGTLWEINGVSRAATEMEGKVKAGDTVHILSGVVKLKLGSGSILVMQGPARASFPDVRRPVLEEGWLWIDTEGTHDDFEVAVPGLRVRDIGTRFGVRVGREGDSEIHVLEGKVDVLEKEGNTQIAELVPDGKGMSINENGTRNDIPLAGDPFHMVQRILAGRGTYRNTILGQNPSGYWKFDEDVAKWAENQVREGRMARCSPAVIAHAESSDARERLDGFGPSNRSVYLPAGESGSASRSVVAILDSGNGASRAKGAVTFWIRRASQRNEPQSLWLAGDNDGDDNFPDDALAHVYLNATGYLVFFMENGDQDLRMSTDRQVNDDGWHQIGVSWESSSVDLYLDGERIANRDDMPVLSDWMSYGNFLRFGKPSDREYKGGMRNFHGWLDEFAAWDRPLTPGEIRQQYKAARGMTND